MECLKCGQESKKNELVIAVYQTRGDGRLPTSNQFSAGFVHVECPILIGQKMRAALKRINAEWKSG